MALLSVQNNGLTGLNKTMASASATDTFVNDGQTYLFVKNGSGASITVTVTATGACSHGSLHNVVVTVPAGAEMQIGKFDPVRFNDVNGIATVTYSATASVTVAVVRN